MTQPFDAAGSAAHSNPGDPQPASGRDLPAGHVHELVTVPESVPMVVLLGQRDEALRAVERGFPGVDVHVRGNTVALTGPPGDVGLAQRLVEELVTVASAGQPLSGDAVDRAVSMLRDARKHGATRPAEVFTTDIVSSRGKTIRPKTVGQKSYVDAIDESTITFGIGPAGTGKTYLAMAKAVSALQAGQVTRLILTRPAVEAGERLGYLPGTLTDKIDPYLRPLYDALHDMLEPETIPKLMAAGTIEVAPLAYMRGRTLNSSFIILDEAQNTSPEQMKMFLTRLGFDSKVVVTGDVTQVDLPSGQRSGLRVVQEILDGVEDVTFCRLSSADVVRHKLVGDIIDAYERWDAIGAGPGGTASGNRGGGGAGPGGRGRPERSRGRDGRGAR
ncbi:PhoH family protein [Bogoriella caseilytica]|uniref:PhoH-like protein n=1 Tax=Bogoriella caseilytica TaxID=56055 RepID=A0A3N2B903_9MICO|nr:PhoH family protein [Bogoriella caseilytica]ROR71755.1 phosphate starvation-inducible protein PhoH [Bogoriella caseilytica]